jgi:hypothetical protein
LGGQRFEEWGDLGPPKKSIVELRKQLLALKGDDFWSRFGRWFFTRGPERTISPNSKITVAKLERFQTEAAAKDNAARAKTPPGTYNLRTAAILNELHPRAASLARELIDKAKEKGIDAGLISGMRSLAAQEELYAQGRTKPGPIVTNAKIVHNTGLAFDVGVFKNGAYVPEGPEYAILGQIGKQIG